MCYTVGNHGQADLHTTNFAREDYIVCQLSSQENLPMCSAHALSRTVCKTHLCQHLQSAEHRTMWCCGMGKAPVFIVLACQFCLLVCHVGATPWSAASPASHVRWAMHATCNMPLLHFVYLIALQLCLRVVSYMLPPSRSCAMLAAVCIL